MMLYITHNKKLKMKTDKVNWKRVFKKNKNIQFYYYCYYSSSVIVIITCFNYLEKKYTIKQIILKIGNEFIFFFSRFGKRDQNGPMQHP